MTSLLIVDDEITIVEIIRTSYDWQSLGVDQVMTAYSVKQAMNVMRKHTIDLLLCDIEMGIHSGLELLQWIKETKYPVVSYVLTGYAEFDFCKQAFELGCVDYLLKPLQTEVLRKAIDRGKQMIEERNNKELINKRMHIINSNTSSLYAQFWIEVVSNSLSSDDMILQKAEEMGVRLSPSDKFFLVLTHWYQLQETQDDPSKNRSKIRETLNRIAMEHFPGIVTVMPTYINNSSYYLMKEVDMPHSEILRITSEGCQNMITEMKRLLEVNCVCCISSFHPPRDVSKQFHSMYSFMRHQKEIDGKVYILSNSENQHFSTVATSGRFEAVISEWAAMIENGQITQLFERVKSFFETWENSGEDEKWVSDFQVDFQQMIKAVAYKNEISILLPDMELWRAASIAKIYQQCTGTMRELYVRINNGKKESPMIEKAKRYIIEHVIEGDTSRQGIAEHLSINPEYLSHLFKGHLGITLQDYVSQIKIETACDLLKHTDLSISDISMKLGYANFSYFSQLFRKLTKLSPGKYRKTYLVQCNTPVFFQSESE